MPPITTTITFTFTFTPHPPPTSHRPTASKKAEKITLTKLVESNTVVSELELKLAALKGQEAASKDNDASTFADRDDDTTNTTRESREVEERVGGEDAEGTRRAGGGVGANASGAGGPTRRRPLPSPKALAEAEARSEKWHKRAEELERELARCHRDEEEALDKMDGMQIREEEAKEIFQRRTFVIVTFAFDL